MMKIQFSNKNMTVPDRVYSHAEQRINELDHLFRGEPEAVVVFSAEDGIPARFICVVSKTVTPLLLSLGVLPVSR